MRKSISLTEGSVTKGLILFAIPILLSNLFQQLYNSVDSAVVGQYAGPASLAAVGSTGSLINLLIGFFLGIATGTSVLYAMHYGAEDYPGLKKLIDTAMIISVVAGVLISVVGICLCRPLLIWMDMPEEVLPLAVRYLRIFFGGAVITLIYNVGAAMIRAEGDSTRPLIYLVLGGITNFILDMVLVAGFKMGVAGAAIATVAAQAVSAVLVVLHLMRLNPVYRFRPLHMTFDKLAAWDILRISIPCGLQGSMFNISNLLVQAKFNSFGMVAVAGISAYNKIDGFIYMPIFALSFSVSTYVGQNIGAAKFDRIRKGVRLCVILSAAIGIVMGGLILLFCDPLLALFTDDAAAKTYALQMMRFMAPFAWIFAFSDILGGAIRGAGQALQVTVISALCVCAFRILWLFIGLALLHDIRIVFLCYPISWALSSAVMTLFYFKGSRLMRTVKSQTAAVTQT